MKGVIRKWSELDYESVERSNTLSDQMTCSRSNDTVVNRNYQVTWSKMYGVELLNTVEYWSGYQENSNNLKKLGFSW